MEIEKYLPNKKFEEDFFELFKRIENYFSQNNNLIESKLLKKNIEVSSQTSNDYITINFSNGSSKKKIRFSCHYGIEDMRDAHNYFDKEKKEFTIPYEQIPFKKSIIVSETDWSKPVEYKKELSELSPTDFLIDAAETKYIFDLRFSIKDKNEAMNSFMTHLHKVVEYLCA